MQWWMFSLWLILQTITSAPSDFTYLRCLPVENFDRISLAKFFWRMLAGITTLQQGGQLLHLLLSKEVGICGTALAVLCVVVVPLEGIL